LPERDEKEGPRVRPIWTGTISFGLVSVPVELYPANRAHPVSLRMLDSDGTPLARRYYCPEDERELARHEIVRGYEVAKDEFVIVSDEELESVEPEKSGDIDLRLFASADEIDPLYFERSYFLAPAGKSSKAYRLLAETMEDSKRTGIATFVMREREYLVAIIAENGVLRAVTMRFADEVRTPEDVGLPEKGTAKATELRRMEREIGKLTRRSLDPSELHDDRAERLLDLVVRKQAEGTDVVETELAGEGDEESAVIDLMAELKKRMQATSEEGGGRRAPRRSSSGCSKRSTARSSRKRTGSARKSTRKRKAS
jgi:DNA end-binding protein Ku